jgi:hypothetical protein
MKTILGGLLVLSPFVFGCSGDNPAAEASEALARQFHERLDSISAEPDTVAPEGWPEWEADLFVVGFDGVGEDLDLDPDLRAVLEAYWYGNVVAEVAPDASLAEQAQQLDASHARMSVAFEAYAQALRARIDADGDDTAARGLLALATQLHLSATQSLYFQYPRYDLLNRTVLDETLVLDTPHCTLFDDSQGSADWVGGCGLPSKQRRSAETDVTELCVDLVKEILEEQPDSPWAETVKEGGHLGNIRVTRGASFELPGSTVTDDPEFGPNVVITTESISVDGSEVVTFEDGPAPDAEALGIRFKALDDRLRSKAAAERNPDADGPAHKPGKYIIQADCGVPWGLLRDIIDAAARHGLDKPNFLVMGATPNPLLRYTRLFAIHAQHLASAGGPNIPLLAVRTDGFEVISPRRVEIPTLVDGARDHESLQRQLRELHGAASFDTAIAVHAAPGVRFDTFVATLDTIREDGCDDDGKCSSLYPEVWLVTGELP